MNHAEMKFEKKWQKLPHFPSAYFKYPKYEHVKEITSHKREGGYAWRFLISHSDLLEEQSYRDDTYNGQCQVSAIDFLHTDKLLAKKK